MSEHNQFEEEEFSTEMNRDTILRIFGQLKPHKMQVAAFMVAVAVVAGIEAFMTFVMKLIIDEGVMVQNSARLGELIGIYTIAMIALAMGVFTFIYFTGRLGQLVVYDLRKKLFEHLQTLSLSYYSATPVGWIMSRVTSDSQRISELVSWGILDITWAVANIFTAFAFMMTINWQLTLMILPLVPILLYVAIWFRKRILVHYRDSRKYNSKITGQYNEMITGVRVIKALNREATSLEEFGEISRDMYKSSYRAAWYSALFLPAVQILSAIVVGVIIYIGGVQLGDPVAGMTIGGINAFISYITFIMWPIQDMARVYASMQHAVASAERSFSLLDTKAEIVDKPNATDPGTIRGDIVFENVTFYYDEKKPVLTDFSLALKAGETVALVGHTGSGKSTLVNLICRFYEPVKGRILINGMDYTDMTIEAIQSRIGMVLQTPHLFSGTVLENIQYGRLDATREEVIEAAKTAGAHGFIENLEHGYDEPVGEGGSLLSVGQKQLISIARAILSRPEIFIMDEATSSVDTLTEALIQQGMDLLMQGRTSFIIAHRLSTIKSADRIVVMENGRIIEMGTHSQLLRQHGHYFNLYTKQFRSERTAEYEKEGSPNVVQPA